MHIQTHTRHPDHFIINPIPFFWTFFFCFPSFLSCVVLHCPRQATLSYCNPGGWGPATFHQHLTAYQSTLSAWGREMRVEALHSSPLQLTKPAGCQQTSICKLGLRNMRLVTKTKASGVVCFSVWVKNTGSEVHWSPHSLPCCSGDRCWTLEHGQPFTPPKCRGP